MKNVFYLLTIIFLVISCDSDFKREYYKDGTIKKEYFIRKNQLNGTYKEFYPSGNLKLIHSYLDGKKSNLSNYYFDEKDTILNSKILWINDSIGKEVIFTKEGVKKGSGKIFDNKKSYRIDKWIFNKRNKDSVVQYKIYDSKTYVNQIWLIDKIKKDTISHLSNYYKLDIQDTVIANEVLRVKLALIEPFYNYNSDIEVILPVNDKELSFDFSNIKEIKKDTFPSLQNDEIPHPEIPDWVPQNHIVEFGLIYEKSGSHLIRGVLTEYVLDTTSMDNNRLERRLLFEKEIFVKPE